MTQITNALDAINKFQGESLTKTLAIIEKEISGLDANQSIDFCLEHAIDENIISSALDIKKIASQINVIIHATGILYSLKGILKEGETVESVSLGAGNTGRKFDLETNLQIAEFKFIDWQGGSESIRQNGIFKDFYEMAEYETDKAKNLYVVGTYYPLKFLTGKRSLKSVLSKYPDISSHIKFKYGYKVELVSDYYQLHHSEVSICDVSPFIGR